MGLRATLAALLLSVLAVVATGCGGASLEGVAQAASKTANADSVHFAMTTTQTLPGGQQAAITGEGAFDGPGGKLTMTMDMSSLASAFGGSVPPGGFRIDAVMDDLVMYMRVPALAAFLPAGKQWVRMDLEKLGESAGLNMQQLMSMGGGNDPRRMLDYIRSAADLEEAGEDTVRGVATTRYSGTFDVTKALDALPAEQRPLAEAGMAMLRQAGLDQVPVQVWVDEDDYVRRIRQTYSLKLGGQQSSTSVELEFFGFGDPVNVTIPPADQTVDVSSLGS